MKRHFTFLMAAFALMVSMMIPLGMKGDNYVVQFNSTNTNNDGSQQITSLADIVASGDSYISSISYATKVYKGKSGYGVKLGSGSGSGSFTMNLSSTGQVYATSITFNSCYYGTDYSYLYVTINGDDDTEQYFQLTSSLSNHTYTFNAPTLINSIKVNGYGSNQRLYVESMTVNYSSSVSTVETPTFSLAEGTYTGAQNISISCATSGATIYYTTDGNTPTTSSSVYSSPITVTHTTTLKAFAVKSGMVNSSVASATYTIQSGGNQPTVSYNIDFENDLSSYSNWTFDNIGTSNTAITAHGGSKYGANINASGSGVASCSITTNSAIAYPQSLTCYLSKCSNNTTSSTWYVKVRTANSSWTTVDSHSATSMAKGTWEEFTVDLSSYENVYVQISYSGSTAIRAIDDITLTAADPLSPVIAVSNVNDLAYDDLSGSFNFSVTNPVNNVNVSATVTSGNDWISNVVVNNNTGTVSFATTKNTTSSDRSGTIKLSYTGAADNNVTINQGHLTVATPTFSPAGGTYTSAQNVTISCATSGATIHYTTDGSTPTASSTTYSGGIAVSTTTTIKAIAVIDGVSSSVATATYTINIPYTINFNPGSGSCATLSETGTSGTTFTLPTATPSSTCASLGWTFAGWATASVNETPNTPTLLTGSYTINGNATLYAVYRMGDSSNTQTTEFVFETIAQANNWQDATAYSPVVISPVTITANGGGNNGKYYVSDKTWRMYNGGSVSITSSMASVVSVSTVPATTFTISNGSASCSYSATTKYKSITVTTGTLTYTYATSPDCWEPIATPTFSPAGGSYNAAQNVTLSCSTDGTTIHYTTDGTTPTAYSATYSDPITVGNGTTTVKAIAVKDGHSGDVATATYIIDSSQAGGEDNPYTVAQAIAATPASGTSDWVYVKGVVSEILEIEVMQYHNARYNISDDGTTSSVQLQSYRGRNIYNTDFLSEDELLVGDTVVIRGRLTTYVTHSDSIPELAEGNYIVSLSRAVEPVTFSPESCIMSSDNYGVFLFSESINEGWGVDIYYSIGANSDPIENGTYFDVWGDPIEVTQNTTIRAVAYIPDLDKYSAVTEATYTIVSPQSSGWQGNPYTVSEALDALDQNNNIKGAYVRGVISRISQIETTQYYNATYFISDDGQTADELQVYRGKYISRADFTSLDDILIGDTVTVFGDLAIYTGGNTPVKEFKPKNYIWDLSRPSAIVINQHQLEVDCNGASGIIDVTYSDDIYVNVNNPTLQFCDAQGNATSYDWLSITLSQNTNWNLEYVVNPNVSNQPRTAYLKVSCQNLVSNLVTITQNEYRPDFAELPFSFDGGRGDIASTAGLTYKNLGTDYSSSPKLKFENKTEDGVIKVSSLVLKINEVPGVLTFDIKGNSFSGGTFKVQASADGVVYSDMATYTTISSETQTKTINNLPTNTRYIRWIYVTKSSGNVAVGNIHLAKPVIKFKISCEQPYYAGTQVGTITASKAAAFEGETITLNATPNNGYFFLKWNVVEYNSNQAVAVADSTATTTTFLMPYDSVIVSAVILPNNTEYQYAYSINGTVGQLQTATIGTMLTLPGGSGISGQPFAFVGWTTNPNNVDNVMSAGTSYKLLRNVTFYAVYVESVSGTSAEKHYVRVTEDLEQNWAGDYLIAYSSAIFADGRVSGTTSGGIGYANVSVTPGNNLHDNVVETAWGDLYRVTLEEIAAGSNTYLLKTRDGNYNYYTTNNSNGLTATANRDVADNYPITVDFVSANDIRLSLGGDAEGSVFRYNPQGFFRFYKNCGQESVYLYKKTVSTDNRYTRVFVNEQASASLLIEGPSIIPSGQVLNVTSITNNLGADRLVIAEGGQLVTANDVNATIRRFVNLYQGQYDNYYLISTPVDGQDPEDAGMTDDDFDLYAFDQSEQGEEWQNYEAGSFASLETGKGYLYANNYGGYITMSGLMEADADDVTVEYVSGKHFAGWNLIGNPYPCNVTIGKPFYRLAEGGAALATVATDNSVAIAPMEGVFVYADEEDDVTFSRASNVSTTGSGRNVLSMRVRRNGGTKGGSVESDNAIVRFGEGAMLRKLVLNPDLPQIYVAQDGADYAIVNAEAEGELPISFRAAENGSYTISVNAEEVSFGYLHLIDNKTGADIDLLQTNNYTFDANTADYACRFKLVFATNSICEDADGGNETFAYFNGSAWVVNGVDGGAILQVVDMTGRVILSNDAKAGISVNAMSQGIYVLRLIDGDNVKIQKIINK